MKTPKLLTADLNSSYYMFGNKGACWSNQVHIAQSGFSPGTLCGLPMLSTNWARINRVEEIGCEKCKEEYQKQTQSL